MWEPARLENAVVELDGVLYLVEHYEPETTSFEGVTAVGPSGTTTFESARLRDDGWTLEGIAFSARPVEPRGDTCGGWSLPFTPQATATRAVETDSGFRLAEYRVGLLPVGDVDAGETESGLLPPTLRATPNAVELEAASYVAPFGAATLTAAPGLWYGAGTRLVSDGALDLQARYDVDDGWVPFAWGDAGFGSARQRIDLTLEHPAISRHAATRRLESGAFLRSWRRSAVGINLSGPSYGFAVEGGWVSLLDGTSSGDLNASFGGRSRVGSHVVIDFDLQQFSRTVEDASTHSSTAALRIATPIGKRTAAWVTPGAGLYANYGVIPAELGFEASASGGFFVDVDAGASWTGRFTDVTHRISPTLRLGKEVTGISQRAPLPDDAPDFLYTRVPQLGWAIIELDNVLEFDGWSLELPVGAAGFGPEWGDLAAPRPYFAPQIRGEASRIEAGVSCDSECASAGSFVALGGSIASLDGSLTLVDGSIDQMRLLTGGAGYASPIHFLTRSQPTTARTERWGHLAAGWSISTVRIHADAVATPEDFVGATAGATWRIEPLGFGVSAVGGWRAEDEAWNAMLGFTL